MRSSGVAVSVTVVASVTAPPLRLERRVPLAFLNSANSGNCESTLRSIRSGFATRTSWPRSVITYTERCGLERSPTRYRYVAAQPTRLSNVFANPLGSRSASSSSVRPNLVASAARTSAMRRSCPAAYSSRSGRMRVWKSGTGIESIYSTSSPRGVFCCYRRRHTPSLRVGPGRRSRRPTP